MTSIRFFGGASHNPCNNPPRYVIDKTRTPKRWTIFAGSINLHCLAGRPRTLNALVYSVMSVRFESIGQVPPPVNRYQIGANRLLNVHTNSLSCGSDLIELEHRLVQLLLYFIAHPGVILGRDLLLKTIWQGKVVNDDSLAVAISHLRKALGDSARVPQFIKTIPGVGYQFIASAKPLPEAEDNLAEIVVKPEPRSRAWIAPAIAPVAAVLVLAAMYFYLLPPGRPEPAAATEVRDNQPPEQLHRAQRLLAQPDADAWRSAIGEFRDLIRRQGESAQAYLGIADAKVKLLGEQLAQRENCLEVIGLLQKSLSLNAQLAAAQRSFANVTFWCQRDYQLAEQHYLEALRLAPEDDATPMYYAQLLLSQQRFAESLQQVERARSLNPLNYSIPNVVWIYQMQLRDDLALRELQRILTTEPDNRYYHISALRIFRAMGNTQQAFAQWLWLMRDNGFAAADLEFAEQEFARAGLPAVNRWLLQRKDGTDLGEYTPPLSWARYALAAGENELALDYLEDAYTSRQSPLLWASVDPAYESVREHPRFKKILAQLRLPENK